MKSRLQVRYKVSFNKLRLIKMFLAFQHIVFITFLLLKVKHLLICIEYSLRPLIGDTMRGKIGFC